MPTVAALAQQVGGTVVGDGDLEITDVADLASAQPDQLSFLSNPKYRDAFLATQAGAVLVREEVENPPCTLIVCFDPYLAMTSIAQSMHPAPEYAAGVEPGAIVHGTAKVHETATIRAGAIVDERAEVGARSVIAPGAYVGPNAQVGDECLMHPGSKLLHRCVMGDRVILQAGAVIGSDGFGYAPDGSGKRHKIPQVGNVVLEDDVEVGANATVDRATFGTTRIGAGTKLDNLVQVAHNVKMGKDCVVVSQSGIAGSTHVGERVIMGAQSGLAGHLTVTDDVMLGARSGVGGNIKESGIYSGAPAIPHQQWRKVAVAQLKVPELRQRLRKLEKRLESGES